MSHANHNAEFAKIRSELKATFRSGKTRSYEWRMAQLEAVKNFVVQEETVLVEALNGDLHRPKFEGACLELGSLLADIHEIQTNLRKWMEPEETPIPAIFAPAVSEVHRDPFGVCLLICPFNYPIILALGPLIGAIAGGNCAVIKPSEMTPNCERVLSTLLPRYLDPSAFRVVCGDAKVNTQLLHLQWDKIFFTGSTRVGKIIMEAASKHLTPVSLELGGKTPVIIDKDVVDLATAAKRLVWGKGLNAGQTCMAPDYCFVHASHYDEFLRHFQRFSAELYGENMQKSKDLSRPVNQFHFERLKGMLEDSKDKVFCGGKTDSSDRFISVTAFKDINAQSKVMQEEIFGPLFPTFSFTDIDKVVEQINDHAEKPLALYIFSSNPALVEKLIAAVPSGGVVVNDIIFQFANVFAPFGGIGGSGMGAYHGRYSFEDFTFPRAVLRRDGSALMDISLRYPPYSDFAFKFFKVALKLPPLPSLKSVRKGFTQLLSTGFILFGLVWVAQFCGLVQLQYQWGPRALQWM